MAFGEKTSVIMAPSASSGNIPVFGQNGQVVDSGKRLADKADLVNGQLPYLQSPRVLASKTIYVNAADGNDANSGSQSDPFKTIQAAINSLPKNLGGASSTIRVAEGVYEEDLLISGFYNGYFYRPFSIIGSDKLDETRIVRSITIANNAAGIIISGINVYSAQNASFASLFTVSASEAVIQYGIIKNESSSTSGIIVGSNSPARLVCVNVEIDGLSYGISTNFASLSSIRDTKIKNCTTGIRAMSGIILASGVSYENVNTETAKTTGGQIFT